jgi:dihydroorotate dehydrogenase
VVSFYENILRPVLFRLDPEKAHELAIGLLRVASQAPVLPKSGGIDDRLRRTVFGLHFPNPVGLAAGFDKNGVALPALGALGFGSIEVGTVTALAQPGNPRPRMFRVPEMQALVNRLGFNNEGADVVASRLRRLRGTERWPSAPVGINLGKSRAVPVQSAVEDYLKALRLLRDVGDYFVINVSSPNTPGLRSLQAPAALAPLCSELKGELGPKPLLLKIAPDLSWSEVDEVLVTAQETGIAGIIATNTTIDQSAIPAARRTEGGLSGAPLRERSYVVLKHIKKRSSLPVVSVGGIMSAGDALARLDAGADLVQVYTGFIYHGPGFAGEICQKLLGRMGESDG